MKYSSVLSCGVDNFTHYPVRIETDISKGIFSFSIVGLGDKAISESRDRIISAIKHAGFCSPKTKGNKIVASLSPAYSKKQGSRFDLAIAISYLLATQEAALDSKRFAVNKCYFIGELALNGDVLPVPGTVKSIIEIPEGSHIFISSKQTNYLPVIAPALERKKVFVVKNLKECVHIIEGRIVPKQNFETNLHTNTNKLKAENTEKSTINLWDSIQRQERAKRAMTICIAGGHHIIIFGPPGSGKSMLAEAAKEILPTLSLKKQIEVLSSHDWEGGLNKNDDDLLTGPFRKVGATISKQALLGGGNSLRAGEVTLSHNGVLFIDEILEMKKDTIEKLREPLEHRMISIKKSLYRENLPANFQLIATANLCPCGHIGSERKKCVCRIGEIANYQKRISGAISDRIDLWIKINEKGNEETTEVKDTVNLVREEITKCREFQYKRQQKLNSELEAGEVLSIISKLSNECSAVLKQCENILSERGRHRLIKVARTIADLEGSEELRQRHMLEALSYRKENYINTFQD